MQIIIVLVLLMPISLVLAWLSMKDLGLPKEIERTISRRKIRGSIIFFKHQVKHYQPKKK
jgi:hypothetical protein